MKKVVTIIIAICMLLSAVLVFADTSYTLGISLCYDGDVYSVDYVFDVPDGTEILAVTVNDTNCVYDWKCLESEARLYINIASAGVIPKSKTIATVVVSTEKTFLAPISVTINGSIIDTIYAYHATIGMDFVAPSIDTPGHFGGQKCGNCGIVLVEPVIIPAKGPNVNATLGNNETLTVSGALSDNEIADGTTFIAVYNKDKRMIDLKNATSLNQSNFSISIENMKDAHTVKVLRWNMPILMPLHDVVEVSVAEELE